MKVDETITDMNLYEYITGNNILSLEETQKAIDEFEFNCFEIISGAGNVYDEFKNGDFITFGNPYKVVTSGKEIVVFDYKLKYGTYTGSLSSAAVLKIIS